MQIDYLVVGAGPFGAVCAERIANHLGATVALVDRRSHIGGLCHSEVDPATGIEVHCYGTHIFNTSSQKAWAYVSQFTEVNGYHHQVLATHDGKVYQMPVNLETINTFYGKSFSPGEARAFIRAEAARESVTTPKNFEEAAVSLVGRPLYEALIREYTVKQWRQPPDKLPASLVSRMPVRFDYREDYFVNCRWQGLPVEGYSSLFNRITASPRIRILCNFDYVRNQTSLVPARKTIYSGALDELYHFQFGALEWRSARFERSVLDTGDYQGTSVMNFSDADVEYTRIHEPRHLHPERDYPRDRTVIVYETPEASASDKFYPLRTPENLAKLAKYQALTEADTSLVVGGRLGDYHYYDMDSTILAALEFYETRILPEASA
jgi:UDP-galactopyranose mutase